MPKSPTAKSGWQSPAFTTGIILAIIFGISLFIRIYLPYDLVFPGDWVRFRDTDPWFYMRLVDNMVHNFPRLTPFDPFRGYPAGAVVAMPPFWTWLLASVSWIISLGSPSQQVIDLVGAYLPAIMGALLIFLVYFIGKEVFNRWAGLLAAGLVAVMPGDFLARTLLGMPDHHVAEIFFSTMTMLFLILAVKRAREQPMSFSHLLPKNWGTIIKPLTYTILTGISLGIYLLAWAGALLFVFIIFCCLIAQLIIDPLRHRSADYLGIIGGLTFIIATAMVFTWYPAVREQPLYQASLSIAIITPLTLSILSRLMATKAVKPALYPVALIGAGLVGMLIFYLISPGLLKSMLGHLGLLTFATAPGVAETESFLFLYGYFSLGPAWFNFTTGFFITFISLGLLTYEVSKQNNAARTLLVVWSLIIVLLGLGMIRWVYYLAINVALLTGYFAWKILDFAGLKEPSPELKELPRLKKAKAKTKPKMKRSLSERINLALAIVIVFFLIFFPNLSQAQKTVQLGWEEGPGASAIYEDLYRSLVWLKDNSPEPFPDPNAYYQLYDRPPNGQRYDYPPSTYTIMSLWGHGYFILRVARRLPVADPGAWGGIPSSFFTAQDETTASKIMDEYRTRYVIVDYTLTAKFKSLAVLSGKELSQFMDVYYAAGADGTLRPVRLFHLAYYETTAIRLYNFDGKEVPPPDSVTVISFEEKVNPGGRTYKQVTSSKTFPGYEEARNYLAAQKSKNYLIVSASPFVSPIPLKPLQHYRLVYESPATIPAEKGKTTSKVKIFEYTK